MKHLAYIILLPACLLFSGCFQVLHYLDLKENDTVNVIWQFNMSKSLAEQDKEKGKKGGGADSILDKLEKSNTELPKKLKPYVKDLKIKSISDKFLVGISISFKAKKTTKLPKEERFPLLPTYNKKKNCLVFKFEPDEKAKKKDKEKGKKPNAMGMDKLFESILSSARYQVILGTRYVPVKAQIKGRKSGKKYPVTITNLGPQNMIDIPFMSISMKEKDGFDLIIYLK